MKKNKNKSSSEDLMMSRSINKLGWTKEEGKFFEEAMKSYEEDEKKRQKRLDEANNTVNQWILIIIIIGFVLYFLVTLFG
tara:strand:+ start:103 stop:342 length:240 start_codon:yes stop_codon:yes gene_type:complete